MHELPILRELLIILAATLPISYLFHRLRLPVVVGYLIAGMIIGPYGFGWIQGSKDVEVLAEIGVVLLLFTIGMEFSLSSLSRNLFAILAKGAGQMGFSVLLFSALAFFFIKDANLKSSLFVGFLLAVSSTAIVLKAYTDKGILRTRHGETVTGILLFQDMCVLPMMLLIPFLTGRAVGGWIELCWALGKAAGGVLAVFLLARLLVPRLIELFVRLKNREMVILLVILIGVGSAWGAQEMGISLAMGAFVAGIIIAESHYSHQLVLEILPFRDFFSSIFFISIGMLLQVSCLIDSWQLLIALTLAFMLLKALVTFSAVYIIGRSAKEALLSGLRLSQIGEFSFLMLQYGTDIFPEELRQNFLVCAVLSMLITPFIFPISSFLVNRLERRRYGQISEDTLASDTMNNHVLIAGFGVIGNYLMRVLKETNIPFSLVDEDSEVISAALASGRFAVYGDVTRREILIRAGIERAKAVVFTMQDIHAIKRGVAISRELNKEIYIIVKTRNALDVQDIIKLGANRVIASDFETTVEMFSRILGEYKIPGNLIQQYIEMARIEGYGMFRGLSMTESRMKEFYGYLARSTTINHLVLEDSALVNHTLEEIKLKSHTGAIIISIIRGQKYYTNPEDDFTIIAYDLLVIVGSHRQLDETTRFLKSDILNLV